MNFTVLLARLAAQILLGIAVFLWGALAVLDPARGSCPGYDRAGPAGDPLGCDPSDQRPGRPDPSR